MKTSLIQIGNSRGLRIPKPVLEQVGLEDNVEMEVRGHSLVITPDHGPREGWGEAFAAMAEAGDDAPLLPEEPASKWDEEEWEW